MNELLKQLQRHYDENQKEFYEKDYYDNDLVYSIDCDEIKLIIDNFNNLQSKIDKAIEIDKTARKYFNKQIPRNIREQGFLNKIYNYLCDIEDILKEESK